MPRANTDDDPNLADKVVRVAEALDSPKPLIPKGKVASYESVGDCLGLAAKDVGDVCRHLPECPSVEHVPYHRIVFKDGRLPCGNAHVTILREEGHVVEKAEKYWCVRPFQDCLADIKKSSRAKS